MAKRLRVFVSSPGDVPDERLRAALVVDKLAQDYGRFFSIETYRWEHEPMLASGHFQDVIEPPSAFDIVVLILWSRLGTVLPERYEGLDGRTPVTGTEWEYEDALRAARETGAPDLLAFRNTNPALIETRDPEAQRRTTAQLQALDEFWRRHFADRGQFLAAYTEYKDLEGFSRTLEQSLRKLIERRITQHEAPEFFWSQAPFRGLDAYEFEHAPIFFGRDEVVGRAAEQFASQSRAGSSFLLVSGPSGSGKSSLVKAAVVPRLMRPQRIEKISFVRRAVFRPGDAGNDLILAFVNALIHVGQGDVGLHEVLAPGQQPEHLARHLRAAAAEPSFPFTSALARITETSRAQGKLLRYEEAKMLLVVDQLEELFTTDGITADDRALFVRLLAGFARSGAIWVIATMRADFWHRAAELPELMGLVAGLGRIDVGVPSRAELAEMIRKPAQAAGLTFETNTQSGIGLDAIIADDAAAAPGALPLLSFTLDAIYRQDVSSGLHELTFATYDSLGRIEGAIAKRADEIVASLPPPAQAALPRLLRALATVSEGDQIPVARTASLEELSTNKDVHTAAIALIESRLLVASEGAGVPTVRLAHEALIRRWDKAREQLAADRRDLETRSVVERQLARWRADFRGIRKQRLLRDADLASAIDLEKRWGVELAPSVRQFIADSQRAQKLRSRILQATAAAFAVLFVVATGAFFVAAQQRNEAFQASEIAGRERARAEDAANREKKAADQALAGQSELSAIVADRVVRPAVERGEISQAIRTALGVLPADVLKPSRPLSAEALASLSYAINADRRVIGELTGHDRLIWSMSFSPDGSLLATGSADKTIKLWNVAEQRVLFTLQGGHEDVVTGVAFTPDGKRLVSVGGKRAVAWDVKTGRALREFNGHQRNIQHVNVFPDGQRFVTSAWDHTARIWDFSSSEPKLTIAGPPPETSNRGDSIMRAVAQATFHMFGSMEHATLSPDGKRLVTGGNVFAAAQLWNAETGKQIATLSGHRSTGGFQFNQIIFNQSGTQIATASSDGTARIWDAATGNFVHEFGAFNAPSMSAIAFSPVRERFVTGNASGEVRIWDNVTRKRIADLQGHTSGIKSIDFSLDGRTIATVSDDAVGIWEASSGRSLMFSSGRRRFANVRISPDGRIVAATDQDDLVKLWRVRPDPPNYSINAPQERAAATEQATAIAPDQKTIAVYSTSSKSRTITLINLTTRERNEIAGATPQFTPDGRYVVTIEGSDREGGTIRVFDTERIGRPFEIAGDAFDISPQSDRLVSVLEPAIELVDVRRGTVVAKIDAHKEAPNIRLFDRAGRRLVTASSDAAYIWNAANGAMVARLSVPEPVKVVSIDPTSTFMLAVLYDNSVGVWRLADGKAVSGFGERATQVGAAAFSPDGKRLLTSHGDGRGALWDTSTGKRIDEVVLPQKGDREFSLSDDWKWYPFAPLRGPSLARLPIAVARERGSFISNKDAYDGTSPFSPDGSWVLLQTGDIWRPGKGIQQPPFADKVGAGDDVGQQVDPAGSVGRFIDKYYVMVSNGRLLVVDPAAGKLFASVGAGRDPIVTFEVDMEFDRAITVSRSGIAKLWRLRAGTELADLPHPGALAEQSINVGRYRKSGARCVNNPEATESQADFSFVTFGNDERFRLWDRDGVLRAEGPVSSRSDVHFSSSACRLIVRTPDSVRLLDTLSGREIAVQRSAGGKIVTVELVAGVDRFTVESSGGQYEIFNASSGSRVAQLALKLNDKGESRSSYSDAAGSWILAIDKSQGPSLINLETGVIAKIDGLPHDKELKLVSESDGRAFVTEESGGVWLVSLQDGSIVSQIANRKTTSQNVAPVTNRYAKQSGDSSSVLDSESERPEIIPVQRAPWSIVRFAGGNSLLVDRVSGRTIAELSLGARRKFELGVVAVLGFEQIRRVAIQTSSGDVMLWDIDRKSRVDLPQGLSDIRDISLRQPEVRSDTGIVIRLPQKSVVVDAATAKVVETDFSNAAETASRHLVRLGDSGNTLEIVDRQTKKIVFTAPVSAADNSSPFAETIEYGLISSDGRSLAFGGYRGLSIWQVEPFRRMVRAGNFDRSTSRVIFGRGNRVIALRKGGGVDLLQMSEPRIVANLRKGTEKEKDIFSSSSDEKTANAAFVEQDRRVVIIDDGKAKLFSADDGALIRTFGLSGESIAKLSVDPGGKFIETLASSGIAQLWSAGGDLLVTLGDNVNEENTGSRAAPRVSERLFVAGDGRRLIAGDTVFDVATGEELTQNVRGVSADGSTALLTSVAPREEKNSIDIVDLASGNVINRIDLGAERSTSRRYQNSVERTTAVSADTLFTIEGDGSLRRWNLATGTLDEDFKLDDAVSNTPITTVAASQDGGMWAFGTKDGKVVLNGGAVSGNVAVGDSVRAITFLAFAPRATRLLIGSKEGKLYVWDLAASKLVGTAKLDTRADLKIQFSPDGSRVVLANETTLLLLDLGNAAEIARIDDQSSVDFAASANMGWLLYASKYSSSGGPRVINARTGVTVVELPSRIRFADALKSTLSQDGLRLLETVDGGRVAVRELPSGNRLFDISGDGSEIKLSSFTSGGLKIVTVFQPGTLRISRARDGEKLKELPDLGSISEAVLNSTATRIYLKAASSTRARLIDAETGVEISQLVHGASITDQRFSADGRYLLTFAADGKARLWDAANGKVVSELPATKSSLDEWSVLPSSKGLRLFHRGYLETNLYLGETGEPSGKLQGTREISLFRDGDPDPIVGDGGQRVLTITDGIPRLWNGANGMVVATLSGHVDDVARGEFSAGATRILTFSNDGVTKLWDGQSGELVATFGDWNRPVIGGKFFDGGNGAILYEANGPVNKGEESRRLTRLVSVDARNGRRMRDLGEARSDSDLVISPDGKSVLATGQESLSWLNLENGARLGRFRISYRSSRSVNVAQFNLNGRYLAIREANRTALIETGTPEHVKYLPGDDGVVDLGFIGSDFLLTVSPDKIRIWDVATATLIRVLPRVGPPFIRLASARHDGVPIIGLDGGGNLHFWRMTQSDLALPRSPQTVIDYARLLVAGSPASGGTENLLTGWLGAVSKLGEALTSCGASLAADTEKEDSTREKQLEAEIAACTRLLEENADSPLYHYRLGRALEDAARVGDAMPHFAKAAEAGNADAIYAIALVYLEGAEGVQQSDAQAAIWLAKAADNKVLNAAAKLALLNLRQSSRPEDKEKALRSLEDAAARGSALAHTYLAERALDEREPKLNQALYHYLIDYKVSATDDAAYAKQVASKVVMLSRRMTPATAIEAAARAREWAPR